MTELYHHGIKGQRWGIRRYQNEDGTLTPAGKERYFYSRRVKRVYATQDQVDDIVSTMSKKDRKRLGMESNESYLSSPEEASTIAKRFIEKYGDKPVSFLDVYEGGKYLNVAIGTRSGEEYRGKGYASRITKKAMKWIDANSDKFTQEYVRWWVRSDNIPSQKIAEKSGFKFDAVESSKYDSWKKYTKSIK